VGPAPTPHLARAPRLYALPVPALAEPDLPPIDTFVGTAALIARLGSLTRATGTGCGRSAVPPLRNRYDELLVALLRDIRELRVTIFAGQVALDPSTRPSTAGAAYRATTPLPWPGWRLVSCPARSP
jgi:hypothetical protein